MLLTRQQIKAKKRNAKRLGQLLKDVSMELQENLVVIEDSCVEHGDWEEIHLSSSQNAHSVIGQILTVAGDWERLNHFQIEEKLSQIEAHFYPN
ncbi:MAG: hypothetical protein F6K36_08895 [Symploca sp. SIO3C6]|uniref:Uncharacterized protein n=1 Tax=Symploca sp. SIO1C4 TaxID=2607765 RepID=A0A6B3NM02_9CYAN|nr:hypothetical protein [Symploca sp. SIO3C6]NER31975.1 hypothetical protein [Symploca sp. SIO1C4]NET03317.1 hypothetical protein [Symploca sp. SIO2B6]